MPPRTTAPPAPLPGQESGAHPRLGVLLLHRIAIAAQRVPQGTLALRLGGRFVVEHPPVPCVAAVHQPDPGAALDRRGAKPPRCHANPLAGATRPMRRPPAGWSGPSLPPGLAGRSRGKTPGPLCPQRRQVGIGVHIQGRPFQQPVHGLPDPRFRGVQHRATSTGAHRGCRRCHQLPELTRCGVVDNIASRLRARVSATCRPFSSSRWRAPPARLAWPAPHRPAAGPRAPETKTAPAQGWHQASPPAPHGFRPRGSGIGVQQQHQVSLQSLGAVHDEQAHGTTAWHITLGRQGRCSDAPPP